MKRLLLYVSIVTLALALDQGTKAWARTLPVGVPRPVVAGVWDWQLSYNDGMAFSLLQGGSAQILLGIVAAAAVIAVTIAARRDTRAFRRAAYGLIAGGALGNLVDRVRDGAVTDFVHWHGWPVFNVADAALLIGVFTLIFVRPAKTGLTIQA